MAVGTNSGHPSRRLSATVDLLHGEPMSLSGLLGAVEAAMSRNETRPRLSLLRSIDGHDAARCAAGQ